MSGNKLSSKIVGEEFLVLHEFAKKAKVNLSKESWDYLIGAAETETTFKRNRFALDSLAFRPRVLRDVENIDLTTELFNHKLRIPLILAPIGSMQDFVDGAGVAPTIAAADFGETIACFNVSLVSIEKAMPEKAYADRCWHTYREEPKQKRRPASTLIQSP